MQAGGRHGVVTRPDIPFDNSGDRNDGTRQRVLSPLMWSSGRAAPTRWRSCCPGNMCSWQYTGQKARCEKGDEGAALYLPTPSGFWSCRVFGLVDLNLCWPNTTANRTTVRFRLASWLLKWNAKVGRNSPPSPVLTVGQSRHGTAWAEHEHGRAGVTPFSLAPHYRNVPLSLSI